MVQTKKRKSSMQFFSKRLFCDFIHKLPTDNCVTAVSNIDENSLPCALCLCPPLYPIIVCLPICSDLASGHKGEFTVTIILGNVSVQFFL